MKQSEQKRYEAIVSFLEEQEILASKSKNFKAHFLFEALRVALAEAERNTDLDLDWIWEGLLYELQSEGNTATENYILGFFIYALVLNGSKHKPAFDAVSDWTLYSPSKCKTAFFEIKRLAKAEDSGFWFSMENTRRTELLHFIEKWSLIRSFSSKNLKTLAAFQKVKTHLESRKNPMPLTGFEAANKQALANKKIDNKAE